MSALSTESRSDTRVQPLNVMDRVMAALDADLRAKGHAGMLLQSHVWVDGRLSQPELQSAVDRFAERFPVIGANLSAVPLKATPRWEFRAASTSRVQVHELRDTHDEAVWRLAEELLATPLDPAREHPIQFHLVHRPQNKDVFIIQWVHSLMDGKAGELALVALHRCYAGDGWNAPSPAGDDVYRELLAPPPLRQRLRSYWALWATLRRRGNPLTLRHSSDSRSRAGPVRIATRVLDEAATSDVLSRSRWLFGFDNPSPLVMASAFRAMHRLATAPLDSRGVCYVHVPVTVRRGGSGGPIFHNSQTYLPVRAGLDQIGDCDELARVLNAQFRDGLRRHIDRAYLKGVTFLSHRPARAPRWSARLARETSFVYGYHGHVAAGLETFCGRGVDRVYSGISTAWSPPGLTFSASQWRSFLHLVATHVPDAVSPEILERFLDAVVEDLAAPSPHSIERTPRNKELMSSARSPDDAEKVRERVEEVARCAVVP